MTDFFEIPLNPLSLDYGTNYLIGMMANRNTTPEVNSCSTQEFVLQDFEYFNSLPAQTSSPSGDVREFSAQFTAFGFFQNSIVQPRAPAGKSEDDTLTQKLEAGLFSIFF